MRSTLRYALRGLVVLALVALVATCADQTPVTPPDGVTSGEIGEPANTMNVVASVTCTADVEKGQVDCGDAPVLDQETGAQRVIVGGQGIFVQLVSSNVSYDVPSETFQADVQVGNYMPLILGTPDGLSVTGIRVFHHSGPTVTGGTGTVSVQNADGTATFTGANQPYFSYGYHLPQGFITPAAEKTWKWDVESTVSTFTFEVYVDADIANPNGFVSMSPASALMTTGGGTLSVTGTARDHVGRAVVKTVTYSSADPTIASVNPSTGEVTAVSAGVVDIIGTTGGPETDGIMRVTVDPPTGGFDINFHFKTTITPSQELAFTDAAAKWTSLVTGDLGTELVQIPFVWCGGVVDEYVDDLTINVLIAPIDGVGGILGQAAPCWVRTADGLPAFGVMQFDVADVANLEAGGQFGDVVLHEMGHVLGIGSLWQDFGLLSDSTGVLDECPDSPNDPYFSGPEAIAAFDSAASGSGYTGGYKVPVEDGYGDGTRCVHWRESIFDTELMTGFSEAQGTPMPLSAVTVKSLGDMGYTVVNSGWDPFTCPNCTAPAGAATGAATEDGGFQLINDVLDLPIYTRDASGQVIELRPGGR